MNRIPFNTGWTCRPAASEAEEVPVTIPHDAMQWDPKSADSPSGVNGGWYSARDYLYTKHFSSADIRRSSGDLTLLEFEGVYRNARIRLNGRLIASHDYGYSGFYADLSEYIAEGDNVLTVEAHNSDQPNCRWYSGTGIYRPVWLCVMPERHIMPDGVRITTVDYRTGRIAVDVRTSHPGVVYVSVLDVDGRSMAQFKALSDRLDGQGNLMHEECVIPDVRLWNTDEPNLYTCVVLFGDDKQREVFGVRTVECDARRGFRINGERVILRGCCIHHDNGLLGACAYPAAEERKVALLKGGGYNAIRSAHNPCSKALLDACDRLGMLMLDEYVDGWYIHKTRYDYGTEVSETAQPRGIALTDAMTQYLHGLDATRPVTCGVNIFFNFLSSMGLGVYTDEKAMKEIEHSGKKKAVGSEFFNRLAGIMGADFMKFGATLPPCDWKTRGAFAVMDVAGYNYGIRRYRHDLNRYPDCVIVGSETFCSDAARFWDLAQSNPRLIGDFVWSGMDYLGEVGIGSQEYAEYAKNFDGSLGWVSAGAGRFDLTGKPLAEASYTQVAFGLKPIAIGVVPVGLGREHSPSAWKMTNAVESWSWDGQEGERTQVEVYARAARVKLLLNGREIGSARVGRDARVTFTAVYRPGSLTAVAYDADGVEIARTSLATAGKETRLHAVPEAERIALGDGLAYVRFMYADAAGTVKPLLRGDVHIEVENGEILGFGSACPYYERSYRSDTADTYYGEAMAIIRPCETGILSVKASSPYGEATARIEVR
uniref:DUF4982 domain-containing protein n=1 Tax=Bifidobacterium adolescentis TaxID=1680 RepID=UPI00359C3C4E